MSQAPLRTLVSVAELSALLRGGERVVLLDCGFDLADAQAGERAYGAAHLPGARYAHLDRDLSGAKTGRNGRHPLPSPEAAAGMFGRLGVGPGTQVVAYDQGSGMFASRLWWMLRWLGHGAVAVLDGGFERWTREGRPVTADVPPAAHASFAAGRMEPTSSAAEIERAIADGTLSLVDARVAERFRGDVEPIDAVAGHVPGARNHPFTSSLGADGRFLPAAELRAALEERLGGMPAQGTIAMCGSGVTACHLLLAMQVAGLPGARLYAGSWSEWSRDPSRPVARGEAP